MVVIKIEKLPLLAYVLFFLSEWVQFKILGKGPFAFVSLFVHSEMRLRHSLDLNNDASSSTLFAMEK